MEQFQSSRIQFPSEDSPILKDSPGRYPSTMNFLFESVLGWAPTGIGKTMSAGCNPDVWQERMLDPRVRNSPQIQGALVQKYLGDCRSELETGVNGDLENGRKMMSMSFKPQVHPFLRRVVINLPGNVRLKGLLGLKGDFKRRPLVIMRLGIFSSVETFRPERAWVMMLFEQSAFNVLILENMSSADFVADNNQFSFGGYDEGIQNILIAKMLRDPNEPLSRVIDSVHMFGISLGGHGVLFSSLLNKYNSPAGYPLIQSYLAFCPVVNLQNTMHNLTETPGFKTALVDLWSRRRLGDLDKKLPAVDDHESFRFLSKAVSEVVRNYQGGLSYVSSVKLPPGMKDSSDFWGLNDFWKYYQDVQEPVMVMATEHDALVPYDMNAYAVMNKTTKVASKNIKVVAFPQGNHCTFPVAYDWKAMSTVFQSYILSHSPSFRLKQRDLNVELTDDEWKGFFGGPIVTNFTVQEPAKDHKFVRLDVKLTNARKDNKDMNLSLPLSEFDFRFLNKDLTVSEKQMIVRWLNQNLRVTLLQNNNKPTLKVSWPVAL